MVKKLFIFFLTLLVSVTSWAADPYFEVIGGSFASGNVTVKFTFPEATTVSVTGSIFLDHSDKPSDVYVTASGSAVSTEGNTATATFTYTPWAGISEKGFWFWSGDITATGYSTYQNIFAKPEPPYAEVLSGSLTSGTLAVKVTVPNISTIVLDLGYSYTISLWNNDVKLDAKTSSGDVSVTGNTLSTTFNFSAQTDDNLSAALIKVDEWAVKLDGDWNEAMEITFKTSGDDTPDDDGGDDGGDDGDDDGDDDPVAKPYIAGAFSVSGDKQVQFTKGNLYWNGSDWAIEDNQNAVTTTWNPNHISHFFWEPTADEARVEFNAKPIHEFSDHLFCDGSDAEHMISLEGKADYYALSNDEFMYMLNSRPNSANLYKYPVTVDGVNFCLVIAPDNFTGSIADTYTLDALNEAGLVCLPPTGYRTYNWTYSETQFDSQNNMLYWSSTIDGGNKYYLCSGLFMQDEYETRNAYAIRLVRDYEEESDPASCVHVMNEMTPVCNGIHTVYYTCETCGRLFADAEGLTEISEADVTHNFEGDSQCTHGCGAYNPATCSHAELQHHYRVEPSCGEYGMEEHDECTLCGELFDSYSNPTTLVALRINKLTHEFNSYNVCVNCGYETPEALHTCSHINMTWLGDSRTYCTQTFGYRDYYRCNTCGRYRAYDDKLHTTITILKSDMQITPGSQLHNGHLSLKSADPVSCTQSALTVSRKECSQCHKMYFPSTPDDECLLSNAWTEEFINSKLSSPVGHNFEDGSHVCSRCGFDAVYRKVTVDSEIKAGAHYILVSHIGDKYYAFGKPGYDESSDSNKGYLGFDAVPVNMEPDGRISVTSNKVMTLYTYGILSNVFDNNNITADGLRQRVMDLTFYNPVYGDIRWDIADANIFEKNKDLVLDEVSLWNPDETESMNLHIYNGEKKFYARWNYTYPVDDYRYPEYGSNLVENGALIYSMADLFGSYFKRFHTMILGQNNGQEPRFHVPGFMNFIPGSDETQYDKIYPVYLYLLDTKKFINAENTTAANVSGPVTKEDVMSIFTKAKDSYDENVAALAELAEKYPDPYTEYKVLKSSYQFTTIDLSKARITDGDLTYQDIMDMKNNEFSAPNVIIVLPETSGASSAKARKAGGSSLASIPNVIINGACQTLELEDKQTMNVPVDFTAGNVSYSRTNVSSAWGTLCLPYAISSDENVQLYKLSKVDNSGAEGVMTFTPIGEAEAGQPVVFKKLDGDATDLSFNKENAQLTIAGFNGESTDIDRWELVGTYEQAKIKSDKDFGRYYIAQNQFWNAKVEATVPAFRAWFEYDNSSTASVKANSYTIFIEDEDENVTNVLTPKGDGELEECTEIYDLSGKKLTAPVKGQINIINGKKIFVK